MKALLIGVLVLSGCATTSPQEYEARKAEWEKQKVELKCVKQGDGYDPHFKNIVFTTPSQWRYTKWLCSDGLFHMSAFEYLDYLKSR